MNKKRVLTIILISIFTFFITANNVFADEICNKSKKYEEYEKLSKEEKKYAYEPSYCEEKESNRKGVLYASSKQSRYFAVDEKLVITPQDQGSNGTCWAFSAMSVVETNAIKNKAGSKNYSEAHLIYGVIGGGYSDNAGKFNKYNTDDLNGGTLYFAPTYFFNNKGMLLENEYKYSKVFKRITNNSYPSGKNYITVGSFELYSNNKYAACTTNDINMIKERIIKDGSVQATMYMNSALFNDKAKDYYLTTTSNSSYANHGVVIVGWDDNISKSKFKGATRNGAWIVKNSWGSAWSKDGYFYISYDDNFICSDLAFYSGVTNKTFNNSYRTAEMVGETTVRSDSTKVTVASIIKKNTTKYETIKRVSLAVNKNLSYKVYLSKSLNKDNNSDWIFLGEGTASLRGIKSIEVNTQVAVNKDYMIIVEYESLANDNVYLPMMCDNSYYTRNTTYSANLNFKKVGNEAWTDMYNTIIGSSYKIKCSPNIYVYTDNTTVANSITVDKPEIELDVNETENLVIKFNPTNIALTDLLWESSNNNVVKVNNGEVTGVGVGTAYVTARTLNGKTATTKVTVLEASMKVKYSAHVQNIGWQRYFKNGEQAGTDHKSLRMEALYIKLINQPYSGDIEYRTHIQNIGWETGFKKNNEMTGTAHRSLRLEALELRLTGEMAEHYDIYYQVHVQNLGWLGWAKNGEKAGSASYSYRMESIIIEILPKGETPKENRCTKNCQSFYKNKR